MAISTVTLRIRVLLRACALTASAALPMMAGAQSEPARSIIDYGATHHATVDTAGMVSVQNAIAAEVGAAILEEGGNAVEAWTQEVTRVGVGATFDDAVDDVFDTSIDAS